MSLCTCSPHYPVIDLTPAMLLFLEPSGWDCVDMDTIKTLRRDIYAAAYRFGCFHVILQNNCPLFHSDPLLGQYDQVIENIHQLFEQDFIQSMTNNPTSCIMSKASFRGRGTESGSIIKMEISTDNSNIHVSTEPKQSWELHRCTHACVESKAALQQDASDDTPHRLQTMHKYIDILHSVASCLVSPIVLNLPKNTFMQSDACTCNNKETTDIHSCSMDLLRVFLYDAVSSKEDQEHNLGSNPHTDWGSLTIIWQDRKGGLQNYCYTHNVWNDVKAMNDTEHTHLFVHVGDFLSLALNHARRNNPLADGGEHRIIWPSPRHKVLCPIKLSNESNAANKSARCSLVYFVYPPMGVSLQDAEERLESMDTTLNQECLDSIKNEKSTILESEQGITFPYERYILLMDQSSLEKLNVKQSHGRFLSQRECSYAKYREIRLRSFHQVIQEKWSQVQRKE